MNNNIPKIIAMVAMDENRAIGIDGKIPWHLASDLKRLSTLTRGHSVLMGRKTYFSLPEKFRPLPGRKNFVVTTNPKSLENEKDITIVADLKKFLLDLKNGTQQIDGQILWILGGSEIYKATLPFWDEVYLTLVKGQHPADTFFPVFEADFKEITSEQFEGYSYCNLARKIK